ncbi:sensor domain-containing protein [Acetobacter oryzoeni]|uniref:Sensor domain-containing protein n=1 Tax=Acetobacter oryzoeni TaxID=2500548 RepID=A0A5B9GPL0_9PROT|nr:sensor domain-containing protein [Acetobacter oryzoeni]MCP1203359.1 sensor domain-containing protein [Acetobacter oryzoeni]QEE85575.1 sensor domain-containing protein [Acetobacter oryzoeni]
MRILFPYIAQPHQTLHSLPIAMEIASRHPEAEVHLACTTQSHLDYVRSLAAYYPESKVQFSLLHLPQFLRRQTERYGQTAFFRLASLFFNKNYFSSFQGIVVPERTSLYLRKLGVNKPRLIWTRHGAGDRAIGFARDVKKFDYVLMAGHKIEERLLAQGAIRPGYYHTGVYAKFDMVHRMRHRTLRLFNNNRPTVLYNPHFNTRLSSWPKMGLNVLAHFANQDRYNLIFAPHYRLFDNKKAEALQLERAFGHYPHMLIDTGSARSIDMTYTSTADMYLGDVSSQVAEFLVKPRACMFLNAHNVEWEGDENYRFWSLGPVLNTIDSLGEDIEQAFSSHNAFVNLQKDYIRDTFDLVGNEPTAPVGADAIVDFLRMAS